MTLLPRAALLAVYLSLCWAAAGAHQASADAASPADPADTVELIETRDELGIRHEELAFRPPMRGVPTQVLDVYCASVKLRLYWGVYRQQVVGSQRKAIFLRRMARLARHIFEEVRDVDRPFNAPRLSEVDTFFAARDAEESDEELRPAESVDEPASKQPRGLAKKLSKITTIFKRPRPASEPNEDASSAAAAAADPAELEEAPAASDETLRRLVAAEDGDPAKSSTSLARIKSFLREWAPKVTLGVYTRWRTMWWMMMSCLFTKYYLWDPALDEFAKLKRTLLLYPELQEMKLQQLQCKPTKFFQRIIDVCKILNPLFNLDFGTLSLDKPTRFKSDAQ